jgi:hypothetical protein
VVFLEGSRSFLMLTYLLLDPDVTMLPSNCLLIFLDSSSIVRTYLLVTATRIE